MNSFINWGLRSIRRVCGGYRKNNVKHAPYYWGYNQLRQAFHSAGLLRSLCIVITLNLVRAMLTRMYIALARRNLKFGRPDM